jgi:hypothetical protein
MRAPTPAARSQVLEAGAGHLEDGKRTAKETLAIDQQLRTNRKKTQLVDWLIKKPALGGLKLNVPN